MTTEQFKAIKKPLVAYVREPRPEPVAELFVGDREKFDLDKFCGRCSKKCKKKK